MYNKEFIFNLSAIARKLRLSHQAVRNKLLGKGLINKHFTKEQAEKFKEIIKKETEILFADIDKQTKN